MVIAVINRGLRRGSQEVMQRLIKGEEVSPTEYYFRTTPSFEVETEKYAWLHDYVFIATCERHATTVVIKVFQVL